MGWGFGGRMGGRWMDERPSIINIIIVIIVVINQQSRTMDKNNNQMAVSGE
jgi:hypothetical protein